MRSTIMKTSFSTRWMLAGALVLAGSSTIAAPASAAQCAPREQISDKLAHEFNETPIGMGLSAAGSVLVFYASPKGSWTAAIVSPDGVECVVDIGEGWTGMSAPGEIAQAN
jgi:hypothetical protein